MRIRNPQKNPQGGEFVRPGTQKLIAKDALKNVFLGRLQASSGFFGFQTFHPPPLIYGNGSLVAGSTPGLDKSRLFILTRNQGKCPEIVSGGWPGVWQVTWDPPGHPGGVAGGIEGPGVKLHRWMAGRDESEDGSHKDK
jgi:hypothetical protein